MGDKVRRFSHDEMLRLAASGVHKVDLQGPRGTTLCTMDEIEAMAAVLALSGALPVPGTPESVNETPISNSKEK